MYISLAINLQFTELSSFIVKAYISKSLNLNPYKRLPAATLTGAAYCTPLYTSGADHAAWWELFDTNTD